MWARDGATGRLSTRIRGGRIRTYTGSAAIGADPRKSARRPAADQRRESFLISIPPVSKRSCNDFAESLGVDVPAGEDHRDLAPGELLRKPPQACEPGRSGPLGEVVCRRNEEAHRFGDLGLARRDEARKAFLKGGEGQLVRLPGREAVGKRVRRVAGHDASRVPRVVDGRGALRLTPV